MISLQLQMLSQSVNQALHRPPQPPAYHTVAPQVQMPYACHQPQVPGRAYINPTVNPYTQVPHTILHAQPLTPAYLSHSAVHTAPNTLPPAHQYGRHPAYPYMSRGHDLAAPMYLNHPATGPGPQRTIHRHHRQAEYSRSQPTSTPVRPPQLINGHSHHRVRTHSPRQFKRSNMSNQGPLQTLPQTTHGHNQTIIGHQESNNVHTVSSTLTPTTDVPRTPPAAQSSPSSNRGTRGPQ